MRIFARLPWARLVIVVAVSAAGALGVAAVADAGSGDSASSQPRPARGCAEFTMTNDRAESHDVFDGTTGRLVVGTPHGQFVFSETEPSCAANPRAARRLRHAREMENQHRVSTCAYFRQAIAEGRTHERGGLEVNLDPARRYVDRECD